MDKQTVKNVVSIFLMIIVFSYALDKVVFYTLNSVSDKVFTGQSMGKLNHFFKLKDSIDLVVIGSSRANHHIDVSKISENGFNAGTDGTKLAYAATLIKTLPKNKKQTVLLHISEKTAFSEDYDGEDIISLKSKYNRNEIIRKEIDALGKANKLHHIFYSLGYNGSVLGLLKNRFFPKYNYKSYDGFDPIYITSQQEKAFQMFLSRKTTDECPHSFNINPLYEQYLEQIKSFCDANNKQLILFTAPVYEDNCKDDNREFAKILDQYNFKYLDYSNLFKENSDLANWRDATHLSHKGAEIFTTKIVEDIYLNLAP